MGTAGAVSPKIKPGSHDPVEGSFFVGFKRLKKGGEFQPTIAFANLQEKKPIFEGKSFLKQEDAENHLKQFWKALALYKEGKRGKNILVNILTTEEKVIGEKVVLKEEDLKAIPEVLARIEQELKANRNLSQTVPFFDSSAFKKLSNKIFNGQVKSVGMEDYQALIAMREAKEKVIAAAQTPGGLIPGSAPISGARLEGLKGELLRPGQFERLVCNPQDMDHSVHQAYAKWHTDPAKACMTGDDYASAILWGLSGTDPKHIPKEARWNMFPPNSPLESVCKYGIVLPFDEHGRKSPGLLNPFFVEISSDFLADIENGKAFNPPDAVFDDELWASIPMSRRAAVKVWLSETVKEHVKELQQKVKEIKQKSCVGEKRNTAECTLAVSSLVSSARAIPQSDRSYRDLMGLLKDCGDTQDCKTTENRLWRFKHREPIPLLKHKLSGNNDETGCNMEIWVRAKKWPKGNRGLDRYRLHDLLDTRVANGDTVLRGSSEFDAESFRMDHGMLSGDIELQTFSKGSLASEASLESGQLELFSASLDRMFFKGGLVAASGGRAALDKANQCNSLPRKKEDCEPEEELANIREQVQELKEVTTPHDD
jgi:hypothetical protein